MFRFSEAVTTDGCKGNFSFIPTDLTGDLVSKSWPCSQAYANKDTVVLMPSGMSLVDPTPLQSRCFLRNRRQEDEERRLSDMATSRVDRSRRSTGPSFLHVIIATPN